MTREEFFAKVLEAFPEAIVDEEYSTGELMIATGWKFDSLDEIVPLFDNSVSG
jgi:hypothetical protein